jgi:ABC-type multidrug transport system ATPase subunit
MLTERPFGLGVAWRTAGRPMGAFYPFLYGRDNLRAVARRCGLGDRRVEMVIGQTGLAERAEDAVADYSYGMRQRLGVAAAAALRLVSPCHL